jgi:hypothetical protein
MVSLGPRLSRSVVSATLAETFSSDDTVIEIN